MSSFFDPDEDEFEDVRSPRPPGRDEMNLAEFPFALLTRQQGDRDSFTYEGWITDKNGARQRQRWTVRGAGGLGLPTEYDERIIVALMAISVEQGFESRKVPFSIYQILKVMGTTRSQRAYASVEHSLERLVGVTIYAEGAFWDNEEKGWIKLKSGFHIIDKYWLAYQEEDEQVRAAEGVPGYFIWSEDIWKSIQDGYIKYLDLDFYFGLNGPLARRLYRFLDKRMAYQDEYEIDIFDLAGRLGMARYNYPSKVLEKLQPAIEELTDQLFLAGAEVVKVKKYTRLRFRRTQPLLDAPPPATRDRANAAPEIVAALVAMGLAGSVAHELARQHDRTLILEKIDYLLWAQEANLAEIRNPQGWLRRAIEEDWGPPDGYQSPERQAAAQAAQAALFDAQGEGVSAEAILHTRYGTTEHERALWQTIRQDLGGQMTRATYEGLFPHTMLLRLEEGVAWIGVPNEMVEQWFSYRLRPQLVRALAHHVGFEPALNFVLLQADEWV